MLRLHSVLKNSYADKSKQQSAFKNKGYKFDTELSSMNQQVYYNPKAKKLLYTVKGTNPFSLKDIGTDAYLLAGKLKDTDRYKEAKNTLEKAKKKYNPSQTSVAGHSLGGSISQYIAGKNDKVFTLDKGATFGQKTRSNEKAYRSSGDIVSALNSGSKRMNTIQRPSGIGTYGLLGSAIAGPLGYALGNGLDSHDVNNIRKSGIKI